MAISFVGANSSNGASVAIPAHQAGDLIVLFAFYYSNTRAFRLPTAPTAGGAVPGWLPAADGLYHEPFNSAGSSIRCFYAFATDASTTTGTFTNTTFLCCHVYRGAGRIGYVEQQTGTPGSSVPTPTITHPWDPGNTGRAPSLGSWIALFSGAVLNTNSDTFLAPTGTLQRQSRSNSGRRVQSYDSNGSVASWPGSVDSLFSTTRADNSFSYLSATLEVGLRAYSVDAAAGGFDLSGRSADLRTSRRLDAASGTLSSAGSAAGLIRQSRLAAAVGALAISAAPAQLAAVRFLVCGAGSASLAGANAALLHGWTAAALEGGFTLSGPPASIFSVRRLPAELIALLLAVPDPVLQPGKNFDVAAGGLTLGGGAIDPKRALRLHAQQGSLQVGSLGALFPRTYRLAAPTAPYLLGLELPEIFWSPRESGRRLKPPKAERSAEAEIRGAYGGSDRAVPSFNNPQYVRYGSVHSSRDFGLIGNFYAEIDGLVGAEVGSSNLFFSFSLASAARVAVRKPELNRYTDQYISVSLRNENGDPISIGVGGAAASPALATTVQTLDPVASEGGYSLSGYWESGYAEYDDTTIALPAIITLATQGSTASLDASSGSRLQPGSYSFVVSSSQWAKLPYALQLIVIPDAGFQGVADLSLAPSARIGIATLAGVASLELVATARIRRFYGLGGSATLEARPRATLRRVSPFG